LPPNVALFQWRARRLAWRTGDRFSQVSATRPRKLSVLLRAARGQQRVVELGTGTAWTTISLALADRQREVVSYDSTMRPERDRYLRLVSPSVRQRIEFIDASGDSGSRDNSTVNLLYIDSSHSRDDTIREMRVWQQSLVAGSIVVFDDFDHPEYRGVEEAVRQMGLDGEERCGLFVHFIEVER
jgi:predicted O-methyltransferase YrrM